MSALTWPSPEVETDIVGNWLAFAMIGAGDPHAPPNTAQATVEFGGAPLIDTSIRVCAGVPPNAVRLIVPEPRFGVAGVINALDAVYARKLPDQLPALPCCVAFVAPADAHAAKPMSEMKTPNRIETLTGEVLA